MSIARKRLITIPRQNPPPILSRFLSVSLSLCLCIYTSIYSSLYLPPFNLHQYTFLTQAPLWTLGEIMKLSDFGSSRVGRNLHIKLILLESPHYQRCITRVRTNNCNHRSRLVCQRESIGIERKHCPAWCYSIHEWMRTKRNIIRQ